MTFEQIAVLGLVQGITEFLPISSHAHLILVRHLWGLPESNLVIDVAVHVGTLGAVLLYFWRDVWFMAAGLLRLLTGRAGPGARLAGLVVLATIPVIPAGYLVERHLGAAVETVPIIAWTTLLFGILLYAVDRLCMRVRRVDHMTALQALFIGLAQVLALVPGVSRSGITMTAARMLGFERTEAARFSLLMSMPAIVGAGTLIGIDLYRLGDVELQADAAFAAAVGFASALVAIALMMSWLRRATFAPFVVYRVVLGIGLVIWLYGG